MWPICRRLRNLLQRERAFSQFAYQPEDQLDQLLGHVANKRPTKAITSQDTCLASSRNRAIPVRNARRDKPSGHLVAEIHPTAIVHPNAQLAANVRVGPFAVIGAEVRLDQGVDIKSHVVVEGRTRIGQDTVVHPFACIGGEPQDKKHDHRELPSLEIGKKCVIREHVTIHGCTSYSSLPTRIGDECWILCGAHVAHDCQLGKRVVLSNNVCVAGHVQIGDFAIVGGQVGLKQHVRVGTLAMIGGKSAIDADVLPYSLAMGNRASLLGLNLVGLRRSQVCRDEIKLMLRVYRYLFAEKSKNKKAFAPALDLPHKDTIHERAQEVLRFFGQQHATTTNDNVPDSTVDLTRIQEMLGFVLKSQERPLLRSCSFAS